MSEITRVGVDLAKNVIQVLDRVRFKVMWRLDWAVYLKFAANRLPTDGLHD